MPRLEATVRRPDASATVLLLHAVEGAQAMRPALDDWMVRRIQAGMHPKALAAATGISERTFYRWRRAMGVKAVQLGDWQATFVLRDGSPPSRITDWERVGKESGQVTSRCHGGGVPSPQKPKRLRALSHPEPRSFALTTELRDTGYDSRKAQARSTDRTGTSGVNRSRQREAEPASSRHPDSTRTPVLHGLGSESRLSDAGHAVTTDLGTLSFR